KEQNLHLAQALLKQCINQLKTGLMEHQMHLDENPLTLPVAVHPEVNKKALEEYLQSLRQLLEHHRETHIKNNTPS
ncbi:MAG: hypothetical protein KAJ23_18530, partial [Maribacter sp.]|nr:hypothetical protein [Maribacter sp.]